MDDRLAEVLRTIRGAGVGEIEVIERALEERRRELGLHKMREGGVPVAGTGGAALRGWLAAAGEQDLRAQ
jgi:hypothetical protein